MRARRASGRWWWWWWVCVGEWMWQAQERMCVGGQMIMCVCDDGASSENISVEVLYIMQGNFLFQLVIASGLTEFYGRDFMSKNAQSGYFHSLYKLKNAHLTLQSPSAVPAHCFDPQLPVLTLCSHRRRFQQQQASVFSKKALSSHCTLNVAVHLAAIEPDIRYRAVREYWTS